MIIKLVLFRSSVATKNGKRVGTTEFAHRKRPSFAEVKLVFENNTKHKIKLQKIIIYNLFFKENVTHLNFLSFI